VTCFFWTPRALEIQELLKRKKPMEEYVKTLAQYNIWANDTVCNWLHQLSNEQWKLIQVSSFQTIEATAIHILAAEYIWYQRLNHIAPSVWIGSEDLGAKDDVISRWKKTSSDIKNYVDSLDEKKLHEVIIFKRLNGDENSLTIQGMLTHVFNHSTHHRGQLVTMLRVAGFSNITSLDLLTYYNNNRKSL
jgi:uncharacterized damage-inducible protein DinB